MTCYIVNTMNFKSILYLKERIEKYYKIDRMKFVSNMGCQVPYNSSLSFLSQYSFINEFRISIIGIHYRHLIVPRTQRTDIDRILINFDQRVSFVHYSIVCCFRHRLELDNRSNNDTILRYRESIFAMCDDHACIWCIERESYWK